MDDDMKLSLPGRTVEVVEVEDESERVLRRV
jgi:hypothetical protein